MKINKLIGTSVLAMTLFIGGCGNFLDVDPDDTLLEENSYSSLNEVYSNFLGISTKLGEAAEQAILISELRADLMEPTTNAGEKYWEIWRYQAGTSNEAVNPVAFYNVVLQVNDFLRHLTEFNRKNPEAIEETYYKGMISSAVADYCWAYLNIGKIYGEAVYHDLALSSEIDLSQAKVLAFDELIDRLIDVMQNGVEGIDAFHALDWTKILNNTDYSWNRMGINPDALVSELYMWDGNYVAAARHLTHTLSGLGVINNNGSDTRWLLGDLFQNSKWGTIWGEAFTGTAISKEAVSAVPYDFDRNQTNHLQYWFSNLSPNVYYFKPAESLIEKYDNGKRKDKGEGDYRKAASINEEGGENTIYRYTKGHKAYEHDAYIYIYRAADLWLMLAETLNQLGDIAAADSVLNVGLNSSWNGSELLAPFDVPSFTQNSSVLKSCLGVRGRAGMAPNYVRDYVTPDATLERKQWVLDSLIAEEVALESAFEGKRWFTLLRMSRNSGQPAKIADQVCMKFPEGEREKYRQLLMNPENWFIKFNHLTVEE